MKRYEHGLVLGKFYPPHMATTTSSRPPGTAANG